MKNKWITIAAVAAAAFCLEGVANAVPISGDITFAGGVELNTDSAGTATEVTTWTGAGGVGSPVVISADGSFSGITAGSAATFKAPWFFDSGAVASLWSVDGFTFNLTSSSIVFQVDIRRACWWMELEQLLGRAWLPRRWTGAFLFPILLLRPRMVPSSRSRPRRALSPMAERLRCCSAWVFWGWAY
jgi:hypothetical protein